MSSYVKIWTDIRNDEWFIGLKLLERGLWYELICLAKQRGDAGRFFVRSCRTLAAEVGGDDSTVRRTLGKFRHAGKVIVNETESGNLEIIIPKYQFWQELSKEGAKELVAKNRRKTAEKSPTPEQSKAEQTKAKQSNSDSASPLTENQLVEQERSERVGEVKKVLQLYLPTETPDRLGAAAGRFEKVYRKWNQLFTNDEIRAAAIKQFKNCKTLVNVHSAITAIEKGDGTEIRIKAQEARRMG